VQCTRVTRMTTAAQGHRRHRRCGVTPLDDAVGREIVQRTCLLGGERIKVVGGINKNEFLD